MTRLSSLLSHLLKSNRFLAIVSLIVSFVIWFNLSQVYNPVSTRDISDVPVTFRVSSALAADGYEVIKNSEITVDVTVSGKTANISSLSANDIAIVANITGQGIKAWTLDSSDNRNFDVIAMSMNQVTVMTDIFNRDGEIFEVTAKSDNVSAPDGLIVDAAKVKDEAFSQIKITGAQSVIDKIASVKVQTDVNDTISKTTDFDGNITLFDNEGKVIDSSYVFLSFDTAKITVPISMKKEVPVVVTFTNAPKDNPIKVTPSVKTVVVKGSPQIIEKLKSVELEPINFADITPDTTDFIQKIKLPESIECIDGNVEITVKLEMKGITYKNIVVTNSSFKPQNVTQGLNATMDSFTVKIIGSSSVLKGITADDIIVSADLKSYSKGEHSGVPVTVKFANKSSAWVAGVYTANIKQS